MSSDEKVETLYKKVKVRLNYGDPKRNSVKKKPSFTKLKKLTESVRGVVGDHVEPRAAV